jgi:hypothetical protein
VLSTLRILISQHIDVATDQLASGVAEHLRGRRVTIAATADLRIASSLSASISAPASTLSTIPGIPAGCALARRVD